MELDIRLNNLKFFAYHGVYDFEKSKGNDFIINLQVTIPWHYNHEDKIDNTVSYADLYEIIAEEMQKTSDLIETVATRIMERIKSRWPIINDAWIEISKLNPPIKNFKGSVSVKLRI